MHFSRCKTDAVSRNQYRQRLGSIFYISIFEGIFLLLISFWSRAELTKEQEEVMTPHLFYEFYLNNSLL